MRTGNGPFSRILYPASCIWHLAASVLLMALLAACAGPTTPTAPTPTLGPTVVPPTRLPAPTAAPTPTPRPLPAVYPLSGLPADPAYVRWPPLAVMIPSDSAPYALSQASVVYVAAVEGGIPRYMALFEQVQAEQVGPVRSARPYFVEWACPYGPLFIHWGGSPDALALLGTSECVRPLDGQTYGRSYYFEQEDPAVPWNNQFTSSDLLYSYLENWEIARPADLPGYPHGPEGCAYIGFPEPLTITVPWDPVVRYTFRADVSSRWKRFLDGRPHLDAVTGEQIAVDNLAILFVPQQPIAGDPAGRLEFQTTGEGEAAVFVCGSQIAGRWVKESPTSALRLLDGAGQEILLTPGSLWIEVLAPGQDLSIETP